jgi:hypothetical protein
MVRVSRVTAVKMDCAAPRGAELRVSSWLGIAPVPLALGVAAAAGVTAVFVALGRRPSAAAREKKRRLMISARGRMADAVIEDFRDDALYYSYSVRGVSYTASQNVAELTDRLPAPGPALCGPATVKYHTANPANSILVAEDWCGIRVPASSKTTRAATQGAL